MNEFIGYYKKRVQTRSTSDILNLLQLVLYSSQRFQSAVEALPRNSLEPGAGPRLKNQHARQ